VSIGSTGPSYSPPVEVLEVEVLMDYCPGDVDIAASLSSSKL